MQNRFIDKLGHYVALSEAEVDALTRATSTSRKITTKTDLIREGDRPGPVFVMLEGWAMRYKVLPNGSRQIMAFLMPGDACDLHIGLLAQMDHSIQTITPARVATISRTHMDELLDRYRGIAKAMYIAQLADEGTLRAWIVSMGRRSSIERVAHLICELFVRARGGDLTSTTFEIPFSQIILADALGMTPVHINRMLRELRTRDIISLRRGSMSVMNPSALASVAGFDENYLHRRARSPA
ncbi:Crp/Fnr family transcriptional regulator [Sphingomonas phyllosphaerae]|uniref:Crp/Fnr family transcriptional regulator n=1 Tax=Sphingomonas phyllosphaerae TaxID=257003 RepID=UPI00241350E4|nr:Crp/Fnr family transcriptional regulator [Sphingomonas phyllosphaerae]